MSRGVWKHHLGLEGGNVIVGHRIVHIGVDPARSEPLPTAWVERDADDDSQLVVLVVYGAGHPIDDDTAVHVGCSIHPVGLIWHVYQSFKPVVLS